MKRTGSPKSRDRISIARSRSAERVRNYFKWSESFYFSAMSMHVRRSISIYVIVRKHYDYATITFQLQSLGRRRENSTMPASATSPAPAPSSSPPPPAPIQTTLCLAVEEEEEGEEDGPRHLGRGMVRLRRWKRGVALGMRGESSVAWKTRICGVNSTIWERR